MASSSGGNYYDVLDPRSSPKRKRQKTATTYNLGNSLEYPPLISKQSKKPKNVPKYVIMKSKIPDRPIKFYNIFLVSKAILGISSEPTLKTIFTRDGNLLFLTKNEAQANRFLKATNLAGICPVECSLHPTLNIIKGLVISDLLTDRTESEIIKGMQSQGVVDCKKITSYQDGKVINTPLHILSFDLYELPETVEVGIINCKIKEYIPNPIQCKNCFKLGHTRKYCKNTSVCEVCSGTVHDPIPCTKLQCVNCNHSHRANNKKCPEFQQRKEVLKCKIKNKCSFKEALQYAPKAETFEIPTETLEYAIEERNKRLAIRSKQNNNSKPAVTPNQINQPTKEIQQITTSNNTNVTNNNKEHSSNTKETNNSISNDTTQAKTQTHKTTIDKQQLLKNFHSKIATISKTSNTHSTTNTQQYKSISREIDTEQHIDKNNTTSNFTPAKISKRRSEIDNEIEMSE